MEPEYSTPVIFLCLFAVFSIILDARFLASMLLILAMIVTLFSIPSE